MVDVRVIGADRLTPDLVAAWSDIQRSDPTLVNPYFCPAFTQAVGAVRDDVEIAILEEEALPVGFFPFQRNKWNSGVPVGGRLSSFQGVVVRENVDWSAEELIRGCGLSSWKFDHLRVDQTTFAPFHRSVEGSPFIDLSEGYDAYRAQRRKAGSKRIVKLESLGRKLEREKGPVRFEWHSDDRQILKTLIDWKSQQLRQTKFADVFAFDWTIALLEHLLDNPSDEFQGLLSVLYVKDRPAAISYALKSRQVLHGWFSGYDRDFYKFSPGSLLILRIAEAAAATGVHRFDLGLGDDPYKEGLMSDATPLAAGSVDCKGMTKVLRKSWHATRRWVQNSPFAPAAQIPAKFVRPVREWLSFR